MRVRAESGIDRRVGNFETRNFETRNFESLRNSCLNGIVNGIVGVVYY
jgi:hypothetical protein